MLNLETIRKALEKYQDVQGGRYFFDTLCYPTIDPLPVSEVDQLPPRARQLVASMFLLVDYQPPRDESQFRIYHVELSTDRLRRTDFRIILDAFYRRFPQGNNLFVFTTSVPPYRELAFVSPQRLLQRRPTDDRERLTVRLRTLRVIPTEPHRTDLEILSEIALPSPDLSPEEIWQKHESAFNIERVTERFFEEYRTALYHLMEAVKPTKPEPKEEAKRRSQRFAFAQLFLNRLMVCYFIGDSLVQEVPGIPLPLILRRQPHFLTPIQNRLKRLVEKKRELETFPSVQLSQKEQEIFAEERKLIADLLEQSCRNLEREIAQLQNEIATSRQSKSNQKKLESKRQLLQNIQKQRERLLSGEPIPLFLWEIAFPEIFFNDDTDRCGFDIVIANPPYVRQEEIAPPTDLSPQDYKAAIKRNITALWGSEAEVPGRADLYVPFFFIGADLLKPGGVLCLVTSNAWLDVDYGKAVQSFLLRKTKWLMTIDNLAKRTFTQEINTVITLAVRPCNGESVWDNMVRFVAFRVPFQDLPPDLMAVAIQEINEATDRKQMREYRITPKTQKELWLEGVAEEDEGQQKHLVSDLNHLPYQGSKLGGKYLRAPDIFFTILEKGKDKLVRLGDIAELRFGIKTGANEFFYLKPVGMTVAQVVEVAKKSPMTPVRVKNDAGWEREIEACWLQPAIKNSEEIQTLRVSLRDLRYLLFVPPAEVRDAIKKNQKPPLDRYPKAAAYIRWSEKQGYPSRRTCADRKPWWNLGKKGCPKLVAITK